MDFSLDDKPLLTSGASFIKVWKVWKFQKLKFSMPTHTYIMSNDNLKLFYTQLRMDVLM